MSKNKWSNIFEESKSSKTWTYCIIASITIVISVIIVRIFNLVDSSNLVANVIIDTLLSVVTGVLGAAILNITYRAYENHKLSLIKSISFGGMLAEFFQSLEKIQGKDRRDEKIVMKFREYEDENKNVIPELFDVVLSYSFKTKLRKNYFKCSIKRILKQEDVANELPEYTGGISGAFCDYEFYWANDESGAFPQDVVKDNSYKIYDAFIDDEKLEPEVDSHEEFGKVLMEYKFSLPKGCRCDLTSYHTIKFSVKLPMERESILFLTHEYPTKDTEVTIDYSLVQKQISVYTMAITGAIPVKQQTITDNGVDCYTHKGWILPKSGYVVSWWANK